MAPAWRHLKTTPLTQSIRTLRTRQLVCSPCFVSLFVSVSFSLFVPGIRRATCCGVACLDRNGRMRATHMMTFTLFPVSLKPLEDINITQLTLTERAQSLLCPHFPLFSLPHAPSFVAQHCSCTSRGGINAGHRHRRPPCGAAVKQHLRRDEVVAIGEMTAQQPAAT